MEDNVYLVPHTSDVTGFARWLGRRWRQAYQDMVRPPSRAFNNYASLMGHPCLRHIYYARTGAEKKPYTAETQMVFESGNMIERDTIAFLRANMDIEWVRSQQSVPKDHLNIGARIDGGLRGIRNPSDAYLLGEVKRVNAREFAKITDGDVQGIHDMLKAAWWIAKYPYQGAIYLHYFQEPGIVFVLREPSSGAAKFVPMEKDSPIHQRIWAEVEQKASAINAALENEEVPERMAYRKQVCGMCDFANTVCFPEKANEGLEILAHEDLVSAATEYVDLSDWAKRYGEVKEWLRDIVLQTGKSHVVIGDVLEATVSRGHVVRFKPLNTGGLFFDEE